MNTAFAINPPRFFSHIRRYFGGGKTPAAPAPAAPPPTATSGEADIARRDVMRNAARRKGMQATLLSDAGAAPGTATATGKATLLGE